MKKLFSIRYTDNGIAIATFILRLAIGGLMIPHGYSKLMNYAAMSGRFADPFHIGSSTSLALVIFAEFFCGVFIALGMFTRFACIPPIISMAVAVLKAHKGDIFGEGEMATLFLAGAVALLFTGPGKFSVDKLIGK